MEREMFDALLGMVVGIIWLKGHAVVAHRIGAMSTEASIAGARNLSITLTVVGVYRIFCD